MHKTLIIKTDTWVSDSCLSSRVNRLPVAFKQNCTSPRHLSRLLPDTTFCNTSWRIWPKTAYLFYSVFIYKKARNFIVPNKVANLLSVTLYILSLQVKLNYAVCIVWGRVCRKSYTFCFMTACSVLRLHYLMSSRSKKVLWNSHFICSPYCLCDMNLLNNSLTTAKRKWNIIQVTIIMGLP